MSKFNFISLSEPCHEKIMVFAWAKTKAQISFTVTVKLISAFVFACRIVQFHCFLNLKILAFAMFISCTGRFVSDLVRNPEDWFSHEGAHLSVCIRLIKDRQEHTGYQRHLT